MRRVQKKLIITGTLLVLLASSPAGANPGDRSRFAINREDHQLHMLATYGLSLSGTTFLQSRKYSRFSAVLISSLTVMAIALAKEAVFDREFQQGDMVANSIGVGTQALVVFTFGL